MPLFHLPLALTLFSYTPPLSLTSTLSPLPQFVFLSLPASFFLSYTVQTAERPNHLKPCSLSARFQGMFASCCLILTGSCGNHGNRAASPVSGLRSHTHTHTSKVTSAVCFPRDLWCFWAGWRASGKLPAKQEVVRVDSVLLGNTQKRNMSPSAQQRNTRQEATEIFVISSAGVTCSDPVPRSASHQDVFW